MPLPGATAALPAGLLSPIVVRAAIPALMLRVLASPTVLEDALLLDARVPLPVDLRVHAMLEPMVLLAAPVALPGVLLPEVLPAPVNVKK